MKKWLFYSFFILLLSGFTLSAQNPFIQHYTTFDGLPSNTVYYIYQDSKKFIWFASDAGVVRYDGTTFKNYRKKDGLSSNEVIRIKEDSFGRIWFFNFNATLNFIFQNKIYNAENAPFLDSIKGVIFFQDFWEDQDNKIWFYNKWGEIFILDKDNNVKRFDVLDKYAQEVLLKNSVLGYSVRYLSKSSDRDVIFWTSFGIYRLNIDSQNLTAITDSLRIEGVFPAGKEKYYVNAIRPNLYKYDHLKPVGSIPLPLKMPIYGRIKSIMEDRNGFLWIVTFDEGVFCLKDNKVVQYFDIKEGQAIIQDHENNIWISSIKDGVYKINPCLFSFRHYENDLFQNRGVLAMSPGIGEGIWLTNGKTVFFYINRGFFRLKLPNEKYSFNQICQLKNTNLIVGENGYFFLSIEGVRLDKETREVYFKSVNPVSRAFKKLILNNTGEKVVSFAGNAAIVVDQDNIANDQKKIYIEDRVYYTYYNLNDDLVLNSKTNYIYLNDRVEPYTDLFCFNNKIITGHLILNDSTELLNIDGDSIYLHTLKKFYNLTTEFGASIDLQIRQVISHGKILYLSTFRNIYICDNPLNIMDNKQLNLQLLDINFRNIHDIIVNHDSLYIASDDGLTIIPEKTINKIITHTPIPYFQSIQVNDKESDLSNPEIGFRGNKKISFTFSCINYSSTPILYSYKMEGLDTGWTAGTSQHVVYQNLGRGNYVFRLRVRKPSAEWSKPLDCVVTVKASFWQHPLFFIALSVVCVGLLILIIIRRKNIQIKRRELDHQLITLEQKALQSMMNPHFIFNSLGSIQNYLLQKRSGEAALYLSQFARLIRQNLNAINAANINLEEEVDRLRNYLDLEKMRMENKFEYEIRLDDNLEADEIKVPSMILQPFVENAIWHGIATLEEPGIITITFRVQDEKSLIVIVEDNGIGMKRSGAFSTTSEKNVHLGMEMTQKRLDLLGRKYSVKTGIEITEAFPGSPNPGTRVELVVPVIL